MASLCQRPACRTGVFSGSTSVRPVRPVRALIIRNSYKNLENIDLSRVANYQRHDKDTGSSESQVARLTARIVQLGTHLAGNKKDFAAKRGLEALLSQRKSLLQYVYGQDRDMYDKLVKDFGIRSVVVGDTRGAARKSDDKPATA